MSAIALACTWAPHGELTRFRRLAPFLIENYGAIIIAMRLESDPQIVDALLSTPSVQVHYAQPWAAARHAALEQTLKTDADFIHACDFDRLVHWAECDPDDLRETLAAIPAADCTVIGRTEAAWTTHPRCMMETEALFNDVFSRLIGSEMDFGSSARGFSRSAAEAILRRSPPSDGYAIDTAWPLVVQQAGMLVAYREADGLAWETPDRYRDAAATEAQRQEMITAWDADPDRWAQRVAVARLILNLGFKVWQRSG
ncbi:MAG: hypothetical protein GYB68_00070 [Chloroflexi bacterium]|nr:hypothetical protein [Chloroflexota bacterium]